MPTISNTSQSNNFHSIGNDDAQDASAEDTKPSENNIEPLFKYNKYIVSADARDYYSERDYMLYCKMIDSIIAHDGVIEGFESEDEFFKIWSFLLSEFVPGRSIIETYAVSNEPFSYEDGLGSAQNMLAILICSQIRKVIEVD